MKRGTVIIPESPLDVDVHELDRLRRQASAMLTDLEKRAGGVDGSASWRHDPKGWVERRTRPSG